MVFLEPESLVSLVTGVEGDQGERDDDVPDVGRATMDGHRVLVVPLMGKARATKQDTPG